MTQPNIPEAEPERDWHNLKDVAQILSLQDEIEGLKSVCVGKESYRQVLEDNQKLREALKQYSDHDNWCASLRSKLRKCDCEASPAVVALGLDQALSEKADSSG